MRNKYMLIGVVGIVVGVLLSSAVFVLAGNPDSPGAPGATNSYTLDDIYNRLDNGAAATQSTFTEPAAGPGTGTMHTLNQIMAKAPVKDDANGATTADVLATKTYWSRRTADWGHQTGAMPNNGAVTITPTTTNQAIAMGYHDGTGYCEGDPDLLASNIVSGTAIFGVTGTVIQATGDAAMGDVLTGKTFSNASAAGIAGTMPDNGAVTIVPTTTNQAIAAGYHNGSGKVEGDADLVAGSIARGVDLFGVTGICRGVRATGQTGCWDQSGGSIACAGTGQDGEYQLGCRPGAYPSWGSQGFNRGFTDNGDGTVTDNLTGLIWLKDANCDGVKNWANALSWANGLYDGCGSCGGTDNDCGLSDGSRAGDWRLPNINELSSLVDPAQTDPALPAGHPFAGVESDYYWSSTTEVGSPDVAWYVYLGNGHVVSDGKSSAHYVWPVRGGQ